MLLLKEGESIDRRDNECSSNKDYISLRSGLLFKISTSLVFISRTIKNTNASLRIRAPAKCVNKLVKEASTWLGFLLVNIYEYESIL